MSDQPESFFKNITPEEHLSHAASHLGRAQGHMRAAGAHHGEIGNYAGFSKSEKVVKGHGHIGSAVHHLAKATESLGRADEQRLMAVRHFNALSGMSKSADPAIFKAAEASATDAGNDLKLASDQYGSLAHHIGHDGQADPDEAVFAARSHQQAGAHLGDASTKLDSALATLASHPTENPAALKVGANQDVHKASLFFKRDDSGQPTGEFQLFIPFVKAEEQSDGTLIVEAFANVADLIDGQGEYFSPEGLRKFAESWAKFGNLRGQHDPHWPAGTIRNPLIGKVNGAELGWWIKKHPNTGTDALFVRCHVVDDKAIKFVKSGVFTGLSVGGKAPPGARSSVDVEVDDAGVVLREVAA